MLKKIVLASLASMAFVGIALGITIVVTAPEGPAAGSPSARRMQPGPHGVGSTDFTWVDGSRPTPGHKDFAGASDRSFVATLWYPEGVGGVHPLIVYSHGFMSMRSDGTYVARHLASHGYVVVAADYPATNYWAPGGPNLRDAASQPRDVSFLIDSVLTLVEGQRPFEGRVDAERIGVVGLSLGGLTTSLVTFHPRLRDPRIRAAVSIAGPHGLFSDAFFSNVATPYLVIAATEDAMVDYATNAADVPTRVPNGSLLTIASGSHTGFADIANPLFRFAEHADSFGCGALMENIRPQRGKNPFPGIGDESDGIVLDPSGALPCAKSPLPRAITPGRQHMMTMLGVTDFFQSVFAVAQKERDAAARHLSVELAADFEEASFTPGAPPAAVPAAPSAVPPG